MKKKVKMTLSESDKVKALELFDQGYGYGRIGLALQINSSVINNFIKRHRDVSAQRKRLSSSVKAPKLV
jgi:hypothetical protein